MKLTGKITCLLLALAIGSPFIKGENMKNLNVVFIGNSITEGALIKNPTHDAPPVKAALYLTKQPRHFGKVLEPGRERLHDYRLPAPDGKTFPDSKSGGRQVCRRNMGHTGLLHYARNERQRDYRPERCPGFPGKIWREHEGDHRPVIGVISELQDCPASSGMV